MKFSDIFIEENSIHHRTTKRILEYFRHSNPIIIDSIDKYFGRVKKPYLQKRTNTNIFIGQKKGQKVKQAPDAYGQSQEPHYYFIHTYNCIYECSYCYLQGYFNSPDLVFFVNHDEILEEIYKTTKKHPAGSWFHAGEFSDSLALSNITQEWEQYFKLFSDLPNHKLELRTKSNNVQHLVSLSPLPNVYISFSLSPDDSVKKYDFKTPNLKSRIAAMKTLEKLGYSLAVHLDPMIYGPHFDHNYDELVTYLFNQISPKSIAYISLGTVRFTKDVYRATQQNYPTSSIHHQKFYPADDQILRYPKPLRFWMMGFVQELLEKKHFPKDKIYWCME